MKTAFKKIAAMAVMAVVVTTAWADVPVSYYTSIFGKSGRELKKSVHDLVRPHNVVTYGSLWYHFPSTDCRIDNPSRVWDMYSNKAYYFRGTSSVSGMNKEHSLPKSWWGGTEIDAYTDLNHLYPSDAVANQAKLNYPLGEVSRIDFDNGLTKVGTPMTGQGGGSSMVFEPGDEYKGDFARTYFYMATCYQAYYEPKDLTWKYTYMFINNDWLELNKWSIDLLLKWARQDPVSEKELRRNDAVYAIQNNRNPFIDYPDLMEYIWGDKAGQPFNPDEAEDDDPDPTPRLLNPTQDFNVEFGEIGLGKSLHAVVYVKGKRLTSDLSITIYKNDAQMFSASVDKVPRTSALSEQGYPLVITYTPTSTGTHTCRLLISDGGLVGSYGAELKAHCLPAPSLKTPHALPAADVTATSYTAAWESTGDEIDFYIVTRTVYDKTNTIVSRDEFTTEETTYPFDDLEPEQTHTYSVRSSRLGYTSAESNVITLTATGIDAINATMPIAFLTMDGAVLVKCSEPMRGVRIYNMNGQMVRSLDRVDNDDVIALPRGIYIMTTDSGRFRPAKIVIK